MLRKHFPFVGVMMKMILKDYSQTSMDNKRLHTWLVNGLEDLKPALDRRGDNECHPEMPVVENVEMKEMKLATLSWEQTWDTFRRHGDANDEDDC